MHRTTLGAHAVDDGNHGPEDVRKADWHLPDPAELIDARSPLEEIDWEKAAENGKRIAAGKIESFFTSTRNIREEYTTAEQLVGRSRLKLANALGLIYEFCRNALETPDLTAAVARLNGLNPTEASFRCPFLLPIRAGFENIPEKRASDYAAGMFYAHLAGLGVEEFVQFVAGPGGGIEKLTRLERERRRLRDGKAPRPKPESRLEMHLAEIREKAEATPIGNVEIKSPEGLAVAIIGFVDGAVVVYGVDENPDEVLKAYQRMNGAAKPKSPDSETSSKEQPSDRKSTNTRRRSTKRPGHWGGVKVGH